MPQPQMMAIGDSLFNGVRSLSINESLAGWSAPGQVARALGIGFQTPDYPRQVVLNVEQWLRNFPNIFSIVADVESNIAFWDNAPRSSVAAFDNLSIASTSYADLYTRTARIAQAGIDGLHGQLGDQFAKIGDHLSELFFDFNTRFLLAPQGADADMDMTPLDFVAARKPRRLLVSIGANNGLWEMGFAAVASSGAIGGPDGPFNAKDLDDLSALVERLAGLPPEVEHIYFNALPLPSMVADMMPYPDVSDTDKPGAGHYYPLYENAFGLNYGTLTARQMAANDAVVAAVNDRLLDLAAADARLHVVRIDQLFARYDYKTNPNANTVLLGGRVLSNLMLQGPMFLFPNFWRGGLMGADGMHPTLVGYALMAQAILDSIKLNEDIDVVDPISLAAAFQADTLLQNVPLSWDLVLDLALDIRRGAASPMAVSPTGERYDPVCQFLNMMQFKYD